MCRTSRFHAVSLSAILLLTGGVAALLSQSALPQTSGRALIRDRIDEQNLVTLAGNTRPEVATGNDLGMVADDLALDHMMLQLKRSPEQEQAVGQFIAEQQDPKSPNFHKWLSCWRGIRSAIWLGGRRYPQRDRVAGGAGLQSKQRLSERDGYRFLR